MNVRKTFLGIFLILAFSLTAGTNLQASSDKIRIAATTTTFGDIASKIAGDRAEIYVIASPKRDIHFIEPTPKDVIKLKKADVFIHGGLDLEVWRGPLLDAVGRTDLMWPAGAHQIDISKGVALLEAPDSVSRAHGDIHAYGNPHYWSDPENGKIIAHNIMQGLARLYPDDAVRFQKNYEAFAATIDDHLKGWYEVLAPYRGRSVISYHRSLIYFLNRFGLHIAAEIETKPGIPPTARHLGDLESVMNSQNLKVILQETYYEKRTAERLSAATGAGVVEFVQAVNEVKEAADYISMIDHNVNAVARAFAESTGAK